MLITKQPAQIAQTAFGHFIEYFCFLLCPLDRGRVKPKDYFQVFELSDLRSMQRIVHKSEQPEYKMNYFIPTSKAVTAKVYIIDSEEYSTMLLAEEY